MYEKTHKKLIIYKTKIISENKKLITTRERREVSQDGVEYSMLLLHSKINS